MIGLVDHADYHQNRYASELGRVVVPGCRWLDLGAGRRLHWGWLGPKELELAARAEAIVGCDLALDQVSENSMLSYPVVANGENLPVRSDGYDLVSANMVLEHLIRPRRVFSEVARVLAPGGRFVFVTPNRSHPVVGLAAVAISARRRRWLAQRVEGRSEQDVFPTWYRANTGRSLRRLADDSGLQIETLQVFSSLPIFRKQRPLMMLESLWLRATRTRWLRHCGSNIIGVLVKPAESAARSAAYARTRIIRA